ncbi:MAG: hypothetical protein ACM3SQ_07585 [Betaproteobacteria bacterium]
MSIARLIAATLAASLMVGLVPAGALASDDTTTASAPGTVTGKQILPSASASTDLRAAARREATRLAAERPNAAASAWPGRSNDRAMSMTQGGGGGGVALAMVVGLAASVGVTYYVMKQLKKNTPNTSGQ